MIVGVVSIGSLGYDSRPVTQPEGTFERKDPAESAGADRRGLLQGKRYLSLSLEYFSL
ncbi:hypothetical protein [Mobiluncus curtisii]|uniref:Uncharacterized protein n=1 Tax=Mobiluncus curtisii ATCC 51333 TaxID=887326 RepID=E6M0P5_9ACTO|nr:hypothetical protein [Mobiluncus curtisii]EFU79525.1 hypothetical protein HMPREF0388_1628 [Mobiluncus curtisii ATCC 51333]